MKKKIALILDNPKRDLPGIVLLGSELVKRKFDVFIVPFSGCAQSLYRLKPDVVVLNYIRNNNKHLIKRLKNLGCRIFISDTEGGIFADHSDETNSYWLTVVTDDDVNECVDRYFSWGSNIAHGLLEKRIFREDQVEITGTPRFDFFDQSFDNFFELPQSLKPSLEGRDFVLVTGSFPICNPEFQTMEEEIESLVKDHNYEREFITEFAYDMKEVMKNYISHLKHLAGKFPETVFLYRPHPFEKMEIYEREFKYFPNILLSKDGVVGDLIRFAKALIHHDSSCSIEAALMNIPALSYSKSNNLSSMPDVEKLTHYKNDEEEMGMTIQQILHNSFSIEERVRRNLEDVISRVYFKIDGKAHLRIAESIEKSLKNDDSLSSLGLYINDKRERIKSLVKKLIGKRQISVEKAFGVSDVSFILKRLKRRHIQASECLKQGPLVVIKLSER